MRGLFVILFLSKLLTATAQEVVLSDIKGCAKLYWIKDDLLKQIKKEKDTLNYFHDEEVVIFYNRSNIKNLSPNIFYVINHPVSHYDC